MECGDSANYRQCNLILRTASDHRFPIECIVDLALTFRCSGSHASMLLQNADHVPRLGYHTFSLGAAADQGNEHTGRTKKSTL